MKKLTGIFLLVFAFPCYAQKKPPKVVPVEKIGEVLSCLQTKLASAGSAPPRANPQSFRIRYYYGVLTPGDDQANELQLVVYAASLPSLKFLYIC